MQSPTANGKGTSLFQMVAMSIDSSRNSHMPHAVGWVFNRVLLGRLQEVCEPLENMCTMLSGESRYGSNNHSLKGICSEQYKGNPCTSFS